MCCGHGQSSTPGQVVAGIGRATRLDRRLRALSEQHARTEGEYVRLGGSKAIGKQKELVSSRVPHAVQCNARFPRPVGSDRIESAVAQLALLLYVKF